MDGVAATSQVVVRWSVDSLGGATRAQRRAALDDRGRVAAIGVAAGRKAAFVRAFGIAGTTGVYRFDQPLGRNANGIVHRLRAIPGVVSAEADPIVTIDALPNDPYASLEWGDLGAADGSAVRHRRGRRIRHVDRHGHRRRGHRHRHPAARRPRRPDGPGLRHGHAIRSPPATAMGATPIRPTPATS